MVNSNVIVCAIILTISLHRTFSVSVHKPASSSNVNNTTNYETAGRKPVTQADEDSDETSQEDADDENDTVDDSSTESTNEYEEDRNCTCSGSNCMCCINLNLSFIDLGGPGCVRFNYLAQNDSMAVNISYGERLLESSTVKRDSPESTCMDLFSDLAQMCAKFSGLSKVAKGVKGCVSVEPLLLGVSQTIYDVGCFNMDVEGAQPPLTHHIQQHSSSNNSTKATTAKPEENEEEEEELAAAISQSAEEGIAWFNNFITSVFGEDSNDTSSETSNETPSRNRPLNQTKLTS